MTTLRDTAIRWYRKAFGAPPGTDIRDEGLDTVLDGNSAVALAEASITSHAVLGSSPPAGGADSIWLHELAHGGKNLFGEALAADTAEGPRGIVASATGLALAGRRATAYLSGPDAAAAQDLLLSAAGKHAPLVLHLGTRAAPAHGGALGSGHDTVHLCADSGFFMLFAQNVQQAVDFTYIARQVAEATLVPGLVIMDGEQTALAAQDVRLPSPNQVRGLIGPAREQIIVPTVAQRLLFGRMRRRVPAWHDLDEPVLTGAVFDDKSFALGAAARRPFFDDFVAESLSQAFEQFSAKTGRRHDFVSRHRLDKAKIVLVAQGAAVETAQVAADALQKQHGMRVGVLGIQALRPLSRDAINAALATAERVFVLERTDAPLSGEPPLTREIRAGLAEARENRRPQCQTAIYGLGGLPLHAADIMALCTRAETLTAKPVFLGVAFDDPGVRQPKREVLLDSLRRAYPDAARLGVHALPDAETPVQAETMTIAIRRRGGGDTAGLMGAAGALLHAVGGGRVRSRPAIDDQDPLATRLDWLTIGNDSLLDPGDTPRADVTLDTLRRSVSLHAQDKLFQVPTPDADDGLALEALLGGLFGVLRNSGLVDAKSKRISGARRAMLDRFPDERRDSLVAAFEAGFAGIVEDESAGTPVAEQRWSGAAPTAVRELGRSDDTLASLPRFWDQTGVLYRDGLEDQLTPDPYLATGSMPPLSSTFSDLGGVRGKLPKFDATLCTGCAQCWTLCPDSAIGVVAAGPAALIDAGIRKTGAEAVRQVASKLASRIIASNKKAEAPPATFGPMLEEAFDWLMEKAPLPDDRKQAIQDGIDRIGKELGRLPVAVTKPFFVDAEAKQKDSAELLSIAINPDACKACGTCVRNCEPGALVSRPQDAAVLEEAHALWETWSATPDTAGATLERAAEHPDIGPTAAMLLSRFCQFAMAGGDPAEAGSGEKLAVRLLVSATEFHQQPLVQRFASTLAETGDEITALIRETLAGALPVEDLDAIAEKLAAAKGPRVDLQTLAGDAAEAAGGQSIDTRHMQRLIDLSRDIGAARQRLVKGDLGLGRARYGLAVAGGSTASWAGSFPRNPFQAPVLVDMSGDAAQLAAGLVEGHLEETTELVRLLRLARLEIDKPDGLSWKRDAVAGLSWRDLTSEELQLCPPLLLVGSDEMLAGRGLAQLIWLLNSGLPVKVLVLSSLDLGLVGAPTNNPRAGVSMFAVAQRNAYVAQSSLANPAHFGESVMQALSFDGPALIQVYAPSPTRDGFATKNTLDQARTALACRMLPLFRYDPRAQGVFGSRISLDGNPEPAATMVAAEGDGQRLTPADWALGQQRFTALFEPLAATAPAPVPLHEWLLLDARGRQGKTPFVTSGTGDDERRHAISPAMARAAEANLQGWQTLQELAGVVTPFTASVEADIRAEVASEHEAALAAQRKEAAAELLAMQQKTQADIASKLRSRLLELASRKRG